MRTRRIPWIVASDLDGFFGLFIDNLVNLIIIAGTLMGLFHMPADLVLGRIIPGAAVAILGGNIYYTLMARRLAREEGRDDVTALPYGISTPIMFAYLFLVIGPIYGITEDAELTWKVAVASSFMGGVVELLGAFVGPAIRRYTPRAALLGTLAGIAVVWIALKPTLGIWEHPLVGFVPLAVVLVGFIGRMKMPLGLPTGFVAIVLGAGVAWITGLASAGEVSQAAQSVGIKVPHPAIGALVAGMADMAPYLMVVIPMGLYNFIETMNNIESAEAAGDSYPLREAMIVDGAGTMVGALFGGCFPTTVYIGHPGWKAVGARTGYTLLNGVAIALIALLGLMGVVEAVLPKEVAFVILLYIALVIGAQAVQTTDRKYAPAVMLAFVPHIASYVKGAVDQALVATGATADVLSPDVHYAGLATLGQGPIVIGLILGAITAFLIDKRLISAAIYAGAGAVLSFFGIIHAPEIAWAAAPRIAAGYGILALCFVIYRATTGHRSPP